jgi:hypothetical protein
MPRIIDASCQQIASPQEAAEAIHAMGFDPLDPESTAETALWLRRLNNNERFLGDLLIEQLKARHREPAFDSGYGPQAIILSPMRGGVFLRANIWPSERDHCFQASGAESFVYGVPHDHNFAFLTSGYFGPGYKSDYYEYSYEDVAGFAGETPELRFIERAALSQGKVQLYRAHRDIHSQIPPDSLSVSLNVMHVDPVQGWYDQYGFDLEAGEVTRVLSPNATEVFLRTAIATAHPDALDLAEHFGRSHPSDRLRVASFEARALLLQKGEGRDELWREAELSGNLLLAQTARAKRAQLALVSD